MDNLLRSLSHLDNNMKRLKSPATDSSPNEVTKDLSSCLDLEF